MCWCALCLLHAACCWSLYMLNVTVAALLKQNMVINVCAIRQLSSRRGRYAANAIEVTCKRARARVFSISRTNALPDFECKCYELCYSSATYFAMRFDSGTRFPRKRVRRLCKSFRQFFTHNANVCFRSTRGDDLFLFGLKSYQTISADRIKCGIKISQSVACTFRINLHTTNAMMI